MDSRGQIQRVSSNVIKRDLEARLAALNQGPPVTAALGVEEGHDYWWFLEYGTGTGYSSGSRWGEGLLDSPRPDKRPKGSAYFIPKRKKRSQLTTKPSSKRRRWQLYFYWERLGRWVGRDRVMHPGIQPRAFVRRSLWQFRRNLRLRLLNFARRRVPPTREDLVAAINLEMAKLGQAVAASSPRYVQPPPDKRGYEAPPRHPGVGPLADAWRVTLAE